MKNKTRLTHAGRNPRLQHGIVNPGIWRASTVLFPDVEALRQASTHPFDGVYYGRFGTPTQFALEAAMTDIEGAAGCTVTSSGLAAITAALLATLQSGDHLLMVDTVYGPSRLFCDGFLNSYGISTTYYDPSSGTDIAELILPNTRAIFLESPGSLTFEMQDVAMICQIARRAGIATILDNTWATPVGFRGLEHGVDIVVHAATKYIVGHADAMLGLIVCNDDWHDRVRKHVVALGNCASADDCYVGLRGLRTLAVRLEQHHATAMQLIGWLQQQDEVERVLFPPLPDDPGHAIWKRDFDAACGLFTVVLKPCDDHALRAMVDGLQWFGIGYSWGGYESLVLPVQPASSRTATRWSESGPCLRIHAGLEDITDLIDDLAAGFDRLRIASAA